MCWKWMGNGISKASAWKGVQSYKDTVFADSVEFWNTKLYDIKGKGKVCLSVKGMSIT